MAQTALPVPGACYFVGEEIHLVLNYKLKTKCIGRFGCWDTNNWKGFWRDVCEEKQKGLGVESTSTLHWSQVEMRSKPAAHDRRLHWF